MPAGDNTVMMQQVAKAFVEEKHAGPVPLPTGTALEALDPASIKQLLSFRLRTMVEGLKASMRQAVGRAGGGKAGAAAAADAFERYGDLAKDIGWAFAHEYCYQNFIQACHDVHSRHIAGKVASCCPSHS
jgi:hypothetical protein